MFVGESGVARILQRTCEVMQEHDVTDPSDVREYGAIDLETMQRFVNFHYSVTLDLFGAEISSNAANYYTSGLKGRFAEASIKDDHALDHDSYAVPQVSDGKIVAQEVPALTSLNARLRDDFTRDVQAGVGRWNRILERFGIPFRITLPHVGFHRKIGSFAEQDISPDGRMISSEEWERNATNWLPSAEDHAFVNSLMGRVIEPGRFANWIAPPTRGIDGRAINFEYVRFN